MPTQALDTMGIDAEVKGEGQGGQPNNPKNVWVTPSKTNIAPEDGWLEHYFPCAMAYFQGLWKQPARVELLPV